MIVGHNNYSKKPENMSYYQTYYSPYRPPGPSGPGPTNGHQHHQPAPPQPHHHHANDQAFMPEVDPSILIARQKGMDDEQNKLPPIMAWNDYRSPYKPPQYHNSPKMAHQQVN